MAPKTKTVAVLTAPPLDATKEDEGADFAAFLSEIGADGSTVVQVYRKVTENGANVGKWAYCCKRQASGGILDDLQREYGGGTYNLKYADAQTGDWKGSKVIVIQGPSLADSPPRSPGGEDRLDRLERIVTEAIRGPAVDPLDSLAKMVAVVATLMPKTEPAKDTSPKDMLDMYFRGREEAAREHKQLAALAGAADGDGDALLKIGMPLVEMMRSQQDAARTAREVAPSAEPLHSQPGEAQVAVGPWWALVLRPYIGDLYVRAKAGKDARVYADMVMEDVPDAMVAQIKGLVADRDFPAKFLTVYPAFNETVELQQWVAAFVEEIRSVTSDEDDDAGGDEEILPPEHVAHG
jgi:hypothetical protein